MHIAGKRKYKTNIFMRTCAPLISQVKFFVHYIKVTVFAWFSMSTKKGLVILRHYLHTPVLNKNFTKKSNDVLFEPTASLKKVKIYLYDCLFTHFIEWVNLNFILKRKKYIFGEKIKTDGPPTHQEVIWVLNNQKNTLYLFSFIPAIWRHFLSECKCITGGPRFTRILFMRIHFTRATKNSAQCEELLA